MVRVENQSHVTCVAIILQCELLLLLSFVLSHNFHGDIPVTTNPCAEDIQNQAPSSFYDYATTCPRKEKNDFNEMASSSNIFFLQTGISESVKHFRG